MDSVLYTITVFVSVLYFDVRLTFGLVNNHLEIINASECLCPDNNLTLQCSSANGSRVGSIVWRGSAFNCDNQENEIILLATYAGSNGSSTCNDGAIVGSGISTSNETFISMLSVSITSALIGKSIMCYYNDGMKEQALGSYSIPAPTVSVDIDHMLLGSNLLKFYWSVSASNVSECPPNNIIPIYNITSTCGTCPATTNHTNVTCEYIRSGNAGTCMFALSFVICGSDFQDNITVDIPLSTNTNSAILPILITISILMLFVGLVLFAVIIKLVHSRRMIKATDQMQTQNRPQLIEMDCNVYDTIDEDCQAENNIVKTVDNKIVGIYCSGLEGRQYEEYTPRFGEGVLNVENILIHLRGRVTFKWYKFGLALGVSSKILEQLEGSLDEDALTEVLVYWLKNHSSEPSWKEVSNALQDIIT